jgi:DNA-binding response OmpR family regulator
MVAQILVLEDDPDQSTLICDALTVDGHQCVIAAAVDEANRVLDSQHIDLAILDMNLPGRPGTDVLAHIRRTPSLAAIPTIVVSANPQFQRQADEIGMDLFLVKPLDLKELRTLVLRCLRV